VSEAKVIARVGEPTVDVRGSGALRRDAERAAAALPLPRRGRTRERWAAFRAWGHDDLVRAKLLESHLDALSVLADAGRPPAAGAFYAVWASASGGTGLTAERRADGGLTVHGRLRYASGIRFVDRALVTARSAEGVHLVELALPDPRVVPKPGSWPAIGMAGTDSLDAAVAAWDLPADAEIGAPGWYLERPGFWVNGIGIAAIWTGGAARVVDRMRAAFASSSGREPTAHQLAHLGAAIAALAAADALIATAAEAVDTDPQRDHTELAYTARHVAERAVAEVLDHAARSMGPEPLVHDASYASHVADLSVFVRQSGADADLERLGRLALRDDEGAVDESEGR
jgi:hypothetical protein